MVEISNVKVYELEESIIASGYATRTSLEESEGNVDNLRQFTKDPTFLPKLKAHLDLQNKFVGKDTKDSCHKCGSSKDVSKIRKDGHYYCGKHRHMIYRYGSIIDDIVYEFVDDYVVRIYIKGYKNIVRSVTLSSVDLPLVLGKQMYLHKEGYLWVDNVLFHRLLMRHLDIDVEEVDHIDKDPSNNTRDNLRPCSKKDNLKNKTSILGKDKFIGVQFDKSRQLWRAYIGIDNKRKGLGRFETEEQAKLVRLKAEAKFYGEFAPNIHLFEKYGLKVPEISKLEDQRFSLPKAYRDWLRLVKLSKTSSNSGHGNALVGILVAFDVKYPNYWSPEMQRYHWLQIVTSSSKMHKLTAMDFSNCCTKYVTPETIAYIESLRDKYNEAVDRGDADEIYEAWMTLLSNAPLGIELFMRVTTNYMQLRNVYHQRKNHKLKEDWTPFCDMIRELPYFEEFINQPK